MRYIEVGNCLPMIVLVVLGGDFINVIIGALIGLTMGFSGNGIDTPQFWIICVGMVATYVVGRRDESKFHESQ